MTIKIILLFYVFSLLIVSISSYKRGIYMAWATVLLAPTILLGQGVVVGIKLLDFILLVPILVELLLTPSNHVRYKRFFKENKYAIFLYLFFSIFILLFSNIVPISFQWTYLKNEIIYFLFGIQTYLLVKNEPDQVKKLLGIICFVVGATFLYCLIFEMVIRVNPAGMPLYMLLGVDEAFTIVDMIESQRGIFQFRLQSVYGHPLSLGQYFLLFLPALFVNKKVKFKFLFIIFTCFIILLTGTRGATFPMILLLLLNSKRILREHNVSVAFFSFLFISIAFSYFPKQSKDILNSLSANLQFWEETNQRKFEQGGSSITLRKSQFAAALNEINNNPAFGQGYGYREYWQKKHGSVHPKLMGYESVLLLYLVERGWVGVAMFFIMVLYLYSLFKHKRDNLQLLSLFLAFSISVIMTGLRPYSLLLLILSSSIIMGVKHNMHLNAEKQYYSKKLTDSPH